MKKVTVDNYEYELIEEYKDGFIENEFKDKFTDYFYDFDYDFSGKICINF